MLLLVATILGVVIPPPQAAPDSVASSYATAWNAHDASALGRLFADDADWVTASGARLRGRTAIEGFLRNEHQTWARDTSMKVSETQVRTITLETAVITFGWEITQRRRAAPFRGSIMVVATRQPSGWQIVAGQVAAAAATR